MHENINYHVNIDAPLFCGWLLVLEAFKYSLHTDHNTQEGVAWHINKQLEHLEISQTCGLVSEDYTICYLCCGCTY